MKSDLPVPIINTPAFLASSGKISGIGLAIAKTRFFSDIDLTISTDNTPGAETPINTSAPLITSYRFP